MNTDTGFDRSEKIECATMERIARSRTRGTTPDRWALEDQGLSQQAFAQRVDVSQQAIAKLESPDSNVTLETLKKVAAALGLDVHVELAPATAARS